MKGPDERHLQIKSDRESGMSLQSIGDKYSITRERVRQILEKYFGGTAVNLYTLEKAKEIFSVGEERCRKTLVAIGALSGGGIKGKRYFISQSTIDKAKQILDARVCRICGAPIPRNRSTMCSDKCHKESMKYKNRSPKMQRRQTLCVTRWQHSYPQKWREIQRKAVAKYIVKKCQHRAETARYIIIDSRCGIPGDAIVKIPYQPGHRGGKLKVEYEEQVYEVAPNYIRRIREVLPK